MNRVLSTTSNGMNRTDEPCVDPWNLGLLRSCWAGPTAKQGVLRVFLEFEFRVQGCGDGGMSSGCFGTVSGSGLSGRNAHDAR